MCFAAGAAAAGLRPVCAIYSTFLQRAYDQVVHDVCVQNLPVVFCMDRAGLVGDDGPTHMGLYDIAYLRTLPNMTIMAPRNEDEMLPMLEHRALRSTRRSRSAIRAARPAGRRRMPVAPIVQGKAEVLRQGRASRFSRSETRLTWRSTRDDLLDGDRSGISPTVVNARFVQARWTRRLMRGAWRARTLIISPWKSTRSQAGSARRS